MVLVNPNSREHWDKRWSEGGTLSRKCEKAIMKLVDPNLSVLDIGCGSGRLLRGLQKDKGCLVYGIDISPIAIEQLHRSGVAGDVFDAEHLEDFWADSEVFDVVIISHTLEHVTNDKDLMKNIERLTKKYAIIAVPNNCIGPEEEPEHVRMYDLDTLSDLVLTYFPKVSIHSTGNHLILKAYA